MPDDVENRARPVAFAVAAAAVVVAGAAWFAAAHGTGGGVAEPAPATAASSAPPVRERPVAAGPSAPDDTLLGPVDPHLGVAYPFDLLTHCGITGTRFGGRYFAAVHPLVEGAGNPPQGWGNPYQRGSMTLVSADEARFVDTAGHRVRFLVAPDAIPALCA